MKIVYWHRLDSWHLFPPFLSHVAMFTNHRDCDHEHPRLTRDQCACQKYPLKEDNVRILIRIGTETVENLGIDFSQDTDLTRAIVCPFFSLCLSLFPPSRLIYHYDQTHSSRCPSSDRERISDSILLQITRLERDRRFAALYQKFEISFT